MKRSLNIWKGGSPDGRRRETVKVKIDHVEKIYDGRKGRMVALNGVDLDIMEK